MFQALVARADTLTDRALALSATNRWWTHETNAGKPFIDAESNDGTPAPRVIRTRQWRPYLIQVGTTWLRTTWVRPPTW